MNATIEQLLQHRSIRQFKATPLSSAETDCLLQVAQHGATSSFMQSYSIIHVSDPAKKAALAAIGKQPYIADAALLLVFVADHHRNAQIASEKGKSTAIIGSMDYFLFATADAMIAAQTTTVAAESLDLGAVYLGSLNNDAQAVIDLLELPAHTFPIVGLAIGHPDQAPQLKPRLPRNQVVFENSYVQQANLVTQLSDYDEAVHQYYDLRTANQRVDHFTTQIAAAMDRRFEKRHELLAIAKKQGFLQY